MESLEKDHSYSENPEQPGVTSEEYAVPALAEVGISRRLRDRELLRKRKAEADKKDTQQWVLGEESKHKRARKGKATGRGRGRRQTLQPEPEPEPEPETQSEKAAQQESQVAAAEEEAKVAPGLLGESSAPLVVTEALYPQQDVPPPVLVFGHPPKLEETPRPDPLERGSIQSSLRITAASESGKAIQTWKLGTGPAFSIKGPGCQNIFLTPFYGMWLLGNLPCSLCTVQRNSRNIENRRRILEEHLSLHH